MPTLASDYRFGFHAALIAAAGVLLSGPVGLALVLMTHPQPPWESAEGFARNYHAVQTLPYWLGFLLVGGWLALIVALHRVAEDHHKARTQTAAAFATVFAALIFLNYVLQTTFVPALARNYQPGFASTITALSMANPMSLAWGLEMWGYGFLGVATWLVAPVFSRNRFERVLATLFIANGIASILTAILTALDMTWLMTLPGLIAYVVWNILVFIMAGMAAVALQRRMRRGINP
ncbi:MAG: DUF4386 family protein [Candidatus Zixiibacteriota bacterium]|nr:MAG: DUF4386 family protein [candidate division Zixibacteria bacterium]